MAPSPAFFTSSILPVREKLVLKRGRTCHIPLRVRIGYFFNAKLGHTLIDTGYSPLVINPKTSELLLRTYKALLKPQIINPDPIKSGLSRLGLAREDINTVVITHFHADHIGGLLSLPQANIICSAAAWTSVQAKGRLANAIKGVFPSLIPDDLEKRMQFSEDARHPIVETRLGRANDISGDGSVLCVDLPGHLEGHIGLYFPQSEDDFLYATDAQWLLQSVVENRPPGFPASRTYHDQNAALESMKRILEFLENGGHVMLCHDPNIQSRDIDGDVTGEDLA
ncbi:MAG: MBL fold metallo-hydrolase [Stappiaceae bacterium]